MNRLFCSVENCASNQNGCCCLNSVNIGGQASVAKSETTCQSFSPKNQSASNYSGSMQARPQTDICCNASHCVHNNASSHKCTASQVQIACSANGGGMSATECDSFCCKEC